MPLAQLRLTLFASLVAAPAAQVPPARVAPPHVAVTVVDASDAPIADATVTLYGPTLQNGSLSMRTDDHGTFSFRWLAPGGYRIGATKDGFVPVQEGQRDYRFGGLARARSTAEELEVLEEQNARYGLRMVAWGGTQQRFNLFRPDWRNGFEFSLQGTESLDGREVAILDFQEKTPRRVEPHAHLSQFTDPQELWRGRAWLETPDHRLRRLVSEFVVTDKTLPEPAVVSRRDSEYANSAFGILVPRRVVSEYYRKHRRKNAPRPLHLAVRLTDTYSDFKRFDVSTVSDIRLPAGKEQ